MMNLGIALGGGGAKGLAHVGFLEVLEEHGMKPYCIAGTSIGSVVGALYCLQGTARGLRQRAKSMVASEEFKNLELEKFYSNSNGFFERFRHDLFEKFYLGSLLFKRSHSKYDATRRIFQGTFGDRRFRDCAVNFACNALDIQSGAEVVFRNGPLAEAVWASCAIPGIFPPFIRGKQILVDGGVIDNIPIEPVQNMGAGSVIAVYLSMRPQFEGEPLTGFQINQRSYLFMKYHLDQRILDTADLVVKPDVRDFHWADFNSIEELVERGREAAIRNIAKIKSVSSLRSRFRKAVKKYFFQ
jgi:NTE family protein